MPYVQTQRSHCSPAFLLKALPLEPGTSKRGLDRSPSPAAVTSPDHMRTAHFPDRRQLLPEEESSRFDSPQPPRRSGRVLRRDGLQRVDGEPQNPPRPFLPASAGSPM